MENGNSERRERAGDPNVKRMGRETFAILFLAVASSNDSGDAGNLYRGKIHSKKFKIPKPDKRQTHQNQKNSYGHNGPKKHEGEEKKFECKVLPHKKRDKDEVFEIIIPESGTSVKKRFLPEKKRTAEGVRGSKGRSALKIFV